MAATCSHPSSVHRCPAAATGSRRSTPLRTVPPPSSARSRSCAATGRGSVSAPLSSSPRRSAASPAHQPECRGRRCRVTHPHAPTGVVHTATAVPVHSKPIRRLRHTIEWHVIFFDGIFAESFFAVCKTVHPRDGTTCPRSGAVLQGPQIQPEAHTCTGHQAFGQRLFVRIGIRASEYQVAAESEAR